MAASDDATATLRAQMIENQRLIDELNTQLARKTDEVRIIQQVSAELTSTLELGKVLDLILDAMDHVLGFAHSMILLADAAEARLTVAASRGYGGAGIGAEVPVGQGVFGVVAKRKRIMRIGNLKSQRTYLSNVRAQMTAAGTATGEVAALPGLEDAQSQIGIPLVIKDRLIGVFGVESPTPNAFNQLDELLLSIVANQVANAIDNARLHEAAIERSRELDRVNADLTGLNATLEERIGARTRELTHSLETLRREQDLSQTLLKRMAPPEVIPLMLEDKLEPRRLAVTVLFSDLEDFTAYSSGMEPSEVFAQLNHFFSWAGGIVQQYRGYVNKTNGDGIMALFGVPYENATHCTDAAMAALVMQREIARAFSFTMRIGINTGIVTAGMLGPENKSLYDVLGDAVNVASRMEGVCPVGGVTVSEETYGRIKGYVEAKPLGEQAVKGKGTMRCFDVLGLRPLMKDARRIDPTSRFAAEFAGVVDEVEAHRAARFAMVDLVSLQARDAAFGHNEAVAAFALALARFQAGATGDAIEEGALLDLALAHDVGKHALEPARLNDAAISREARERLRDDLLEQTRMTVDQLGLEGLAEPLTRLYAFERSRGADEPADALTEIVALADIYDALTAPKLYKGAPWRIPGALEELLRLPYRDAQPQPLLDAFVALMKPRDATLSRRTQTRPMIR